MKSTNGVITGYLLLNTSKDKWTKKYFILNRDKLIYYNDHTSLFENDKKGEILLLNVLIKENDTNDTNIKFSFQIITQYDSIILAAKNNELKLNWIREIETSILNSKDSIAGYSYQIIINKKDTIAKMKYFSLDKNGIIMIYKSFESDICEENIILCSSYKIVRFDNKLRINILNENNESILIMQFDKKNVENYIEWLDMLNQNLPKDNNILISNYIKNSIKSSMINVRFHNDGNNDWNEYLLILTNKELIILETIFDNNYNEKKTINAYNIINQCNIYNDCSICDTNLKEFSFQFISSNIAIHFSTSTVEESLLWKKEIESAIINTLPNYSNSLYQLSMKHIIDDKYYELNLNTETIGIMLEKSIELGIVKSITNINNGVSIGSALVAINGQSIIHNTYQETINLLQDWKPPLRLKFLIQSIKEGYIMIRSISNHHTLNIHKYIWKKKYIILKEGKLIIQESSDNNLKNRIIPLCASCVSLVKIAEAGKYYCFKILSGVSTFILHAKNIEEMNDWASILYHSISIANGGRDIINFYSNSTIFINHIQEKIIRENNENINYDSNGEKNSQSKRSNQITLTNHLKSNNFNYEYDEDYNKENIFSSIDNNSSNSPNLTMKNINVTSTSSMKKRIFEDITDRYVNINTSFDDISFDNSSPNKNFNQSPLFNNTSINIDGIKPLKMFQSIDNIGHDDEIDELNKSNSYDYKDLDNEFDPVNQTTMIENYNITTHKFPAKITELKQIFQSYCKKDKNSMNNIQYINVMKFCEIWRIVTGDSTNMFKEMQIFNKFSIQNNGILTEDEFVNGFINLTNNIENNEILINMNNMVRKSNIIL